MATGTLVDVVMPQMGVSVSEGTITRWAKNVGESIEADETIVEISTDKVDTEVPAPATGVVKELLAEEGETVPVNTRIAVIDTGGGDGGSGDGGSGEPEPATMESDPDVAAETPQAAAEPPAEQPAASTGNGHGGEGRTFVSPVVARMVAEHNLDINAITGTGAGGRVTKK
ncbi:MAG TPA: biotin/lipoyl-containing protein, partial [Gaiellales bacterium]|nr:biotin/lipoyl-containing protein [Gaiellales bacterium]